MPTSRDVLKKHDVYVILIRNDNGTPGFGECSALPGLSPDARPDFPQKIENVCQQISRGAQLKDLDLDDWPAIRFGVETAFLNTRKLDESALFISPFSRGEKGISLHGLILMDDVDEMWQQILQKTILGFRCIKLKIGALPFDEELSLLTRFRQQFPSWAYELRLDANGAFSPVDALDKLSMLAPLKVHSVEQPIPPGDWREMARICNSSPIPVALDEELIGVHGKDGRRELLETIMPQALVLKPTLLGGLERAKEWLRAAEKLDITAWFSSALESNIGLDAICQFAGALSLHEIQALGTGQLYERNFPAPLQLRAGSMFFDVDYVPPALNTLSDLKLV